MCNNAETKFCATCGEHKDINQFTKDRKSKDGLYYQCKSCKSIARKKYKEDEGKRRARMARFKERHPTYFRDKHKEYFEVKPDVMREKQRAKKQRAIESGANAIQCHRRRAKLASLPSNFTLSDWNSAKETFNHRCAYCGGYSESLQMEHVIPLSKGGHFTKYNIIPACPTCNTSKNNKELSEWYPQTPFFSKERLDFINDYVQDHTPYEMA